MTNKTADKAGKKRIDKDGQASKDEGIVKPLVKTGLPPGISPDQAKDPGNASGGKNFRNNS